MSDGIVVAARISAVIVAFGALTSCATLDKEECASVDWQQLGRSDGAAGYGAGRVDSHRSACAEHKLPVDGQQWMSGWQEGIRLYCTPQNGLTQGIEGRSYSYSCPPELKAGFEGAYFVAKRVYDARQARDRLGGDLDRLFRQLRDAKSAEEKRPIEASIASKRSELFVAESRLRDAERDYDRYLYTNR